MGKMYKVLGMMSGTSLDGLDLAHCHIWNENEAWHFELNECEAIGYDSTLYDKLKNAIYLPEEEHAELHLQYGDWLGRQAKLFLEKYGLTIDFIASHGHTSHHRPEEGITFQLGDGQQLANTSGEKVVCDFRSLDVKLGGQGAPLAPIGDELLLSEYDLCLNLGGISNISFRKHSERFAYDIGMANMPLNHLTEKIGVKYDKGGKLAATGAVISGLLNALNSLEYYQLPYPKSTGYEWFTEKVVPLIDQTDASTADLLHTVIHHNCEQIALAIKEEELNHNNMLVTGGGALNDFFVETLQQKLGEDCEVHIPTKKIIEYKEALVFALMGVLRIENHINVLSSVTGAKKDSCSGEIFYPTP
ncbi:anhydro-N-acetylmuramic acid kinase [Allomuricauda sp. SCSIO 65647]|uniref:anhydro-N-acetylmuramic acid kinase n=1 Tax=Allomuricauda sp. SCSIO 65647 TaxID=2908843 RepID=UPI001F2B6FC2|nr:anhydro-N-acetylmuramic acid kinase [Muricauda sp. SCSIO 65647]UJH67876.1 anhydro-N-acetylmuramic acid kinase [Muricauda sp. SCSIO 65647]